MTYQPRPEASGDTLNRSKNQIRTNFTIIQNDFAVNHEAFDTANEGKHKFLQMPEQSAAPTTAANEAGFYCKVGTAPAESNLFMRGENNGDEYQITTVVEGQTATFGTKAGVDNSGWTFLPGGLIMMYGRKTSPGGSGTITYPFQFPSNADPYTITISAERVGNTGQVNVDVPDGTGTSFTYRGTAANTAINWVAIGK